MRKIFNKVLAGVTSVALVATLLVGINVTTTVKADDKVLTLNNWSFTEGGCYYHPEEANGNAGYINKVTMNGTNEEITGWLRCDGTDYSLEEYVQQNKKDPSVNQKQTAKELSTGFNMDIEKTGWDAQWDYSPLRINPWSAQALMEDIAIEEGHIYTVSFDAQATSNKLCYVTFGSTIKGDDGSDVTIPPYGDDPAALAGDAQIIKIGVDKKTYTYTFTNYVSAKTFTTTLMLGAFGAQYDYAGNDVSSIITATETGWKGNVYVSDFTITDKGPDPDWTKTDTPPLPNNPTPGTNVSPQPGNGTGIGVGTGTGTGTTANKQLAKVKKLKVKNNKKGTFTISWKKVKNAKKYKVKVGKKTYTTKKAKLTVKKLKKGKKYTVKVRATAAGYKSSAWTTKKKVKVKK